MDYSYSSLLASKNEHLFVQKQLLLQSQNCLTIIGKPPNNISNDTFRPFLNAIERGVRIVLLFNAEDEKLIKLALNQAVKVDKEAMLGSISIWSSEIDISILIKDVKTYVLGNYHWFQPEASQHAVSSMTVYDDITIPLNLISHVSSLKPNLIAYYDGKGECKLAGECKELCTKFEFDETKRVFGKPVVMIIDDEEPMVKQLDFNLKQQLNDQVLIETYTSSDAACLHIKQVNPDLVLTDIKMPNVSGLNIEGLCKEMQIPCMLMSGYCELENDQFLAKPFSPEQLINMIRGILVKHSDYEMNCLGKILEFMI